MRDFAVEFDLVFIGLGNARDILGRRRFARAILATSA